MYPNMLPRNQGFNAGYPNVGSGMMNFQSLVGDRFQPPGQGGILSSGAQAMSQPGQGGQGTTNNWVGLIPGLGQLGMGLFGGGDNGRRHLDELEGKVGDQLNPFINAGRNALGRWGSESNALTGLRGPLMEQIQRMMADPTQLMKMIGQNYQESPGYQFNLKQGLGAANQAAAAGGMAGTPAHQQNANEVASALASRDYNQFMQNALGVHNQGMNAGQNMYGMGFQGLGNISGLGANAANNMAQILAQNQGNKAQMDFLNNQLRQQGILGGIGSILGYLGGR